MVDSVAHQREAQRQLDNDEVVSTYGLFNLPQVRALEDAVAKIEGGYRALTFPSGLAAVAAAILACVKAGDHMLIPDSVYHPTRYLAEGFFKRLGVTTTFYDPLIGERISDLIQPNTVAVYCESPGSHTFEVQDIPAIARVAHAKGARVILDNAWATGYFFDGFAQRRRPGVQPATKILRRTFGRDHWLGGSQRNDVAGIESDQLRPRPTRITGRLFSDFARPAHAGRRLKRHQQSALTIAQWLKTRPEVARVFYPPPPMTRATRCGSAISPARAVC